MFTEGANGLALTATGAIPAPQLLIGHGPAWVLILCLLALCCALLWLVTKSSGAGEEHALPGVQSRRNKTRGRGPSTPGPKSKRRPGAVPRLFPVAE